jgi:hypothetical protein
MEKKQTKYWHSRKLDKGSPPFPHEAIGELQQKTLTKASNRQKTIRMRIFFHTSNTTDCERINEVLVW